MPPVTNEKPSLLKPFTFQGVVFDGESGDEQKVGRCPFCERDGKFYVNENNGLWNCQVCTEKGNVKKFLVRLWEESRKIDCTQGLKELAKERKILSHETLKEWGLCKSMITGEWMLPGYSIDPITNKPKVSQVYLWKPDPATKKRRFISPGFANSDDNVKTTHALFLSKWDSKKENVYILEGLWDAVAFDEVIKHTVINNEDGTYFYIGSEGASLYANANVVAAPGANIFLESWCQLFANKKVTILYDNDHPRENEKTKTVVPGSGYLGTKRITELLSLHAERPTSVEYLNWGPDGFDPSYPTRYDTRDHLSQGRTTSDRVKFLGELLDKVTPIDPSWLGVATDKKKGSVTAVPLLCKTWKELKSVWEKAMFWNPGLDAALPAMIACAASVNLKEDLLWLKVISPASTGKTELAEALALSSQSTVIVSTFTGLHSGMRLEDGEDGSLISLLGNKCFIIKEGDTLLRLADREKVWAELRDAYDRNTRTHYKNGVSNQYLEHPFSHILCGTASLHEMDDSELGQRYLHIVIMEKIDSEVESKINHHKIGGFFNLLKTKPSVNGKGSSTEHKLKARQLTAGYLEYLRANMDKIISDISYPEEAVSTIDKYAQFIAYFRARPSSKQSEEACRELSTRLGVQLAKLAATLAAVLNKDSLDNEVISRVKKVTLDTARGLTLDIAKVLYKQYQNDGEGLPVSIISATIMQGESETRQLMMFLKKIEVVENYKKEGRLGLGTAYAWRLTKKLTNLYKNVIGDV